MKTKMEANGQDFTTDYFFGNYICSLTIFYIYGLVSDNPLFSLFHLDQYPLLLIHLFLRFMAFSLVLRPVWFTQGHLMTNGLELLTGAWWGYCFTTIKKVLRFIFIVFAYAYVCIYLPHISRCPWDPEEGVRSFRIRVRSGCDLPHVSARN